MRPVRSVADWKLRSVIIARRRAVRASVVVVASVRIKLARTPLNAIKLYLMLAAR